VLFNTLTYAKFFALVFGVAWLLAPRPRLRLLFLLGASYVFYAHWDYRFLPLLFASSSIDYWLGAAIGRSEDPLRRRRLLAITVAVNLGVLAIFKYFNFGVENARALLESLGFHPPPLALEIALPVGISFFTFESMSYVIDVYRKDIEPHESYLDYLSFVAFFPHLVAGPIVRPRDLLPQLSRPARFDESEASRGLFLIAAGLLKKVAIGDYLALNLVDRVFDAPAQFSSVECYAAVVAYAIQIYCDFSGYTDMAIGSALLLGVRFPKNFDAPYKATNMQDFWRRWHISLSTWLRDYLYIPLGGSRKGPARTYLNMIITMLLGGLWHGASWTFVIWGAFHGAALALTRAWQRVRAGNRRAEDPAERPAEEPSHAPEIRATTTLSDHTAPPSQRPRAVFVRVACTLATFHAVCFAWIFFRSETFNDARLMLHQLTRFSTHHENLPASVLLVLAVGLLSHYVPERWFAGTEQRLVRSPVFVQGLLLFGVAWVLRSMSSAEAVPFVYFQF
jgi:D-alanyl-lipoteichoic acid acyltransferase DltB (MBOAT superfamily)